MSLANTIIFAFAGAQCLGHELAKFRPTGDGETMLSYCQNCQRSIIVDESNVWGNDIFKHCLHHLGRKTPVE
tara:strand:+ start:4302 stop:4517 length:216 start_codon:yes stop_codon:yes gene_type:complete